MYRAGMGGMCAGIHLTSNEEETIAKGTQVVHKKELLKLGPDTQGIITEALIETRGF